MGAHEKSGCHLLVQEGAGDGPGPTCPGKLGARGAGIAALPLPASRGRPAHPPTPPAGGTARGAHIASPGGAEPRNEKRALIGGDTRRGDKSGALIGR